MPLTFDHSYARDLPGSYLRERPNPAPAPRLLVLNDALARDLGLDGAELADHAARWFSGAEVPTGADPIALAYAGHQFGGFSPQLGDGRAHLLGELLTPKGRFDLQLKGSGRTAFSRGGDGKAAVAPMLREYLISEAMAALHVPTTRSLAVVATGETVLRETGKLPGAVLARVAASHIRVGTFQYFAARDDLPRLKALTAYTIRRHFPHLAPPEVASPDLAAPDLAAPDLAAPDLAPDALGLFDAVTARQVALIAQWMGLGFLHGVMNTDNMALSGETIDYGPCAFMESYAPGTVFSSIDRQGRYAYANQPLILAWNLSRLAEALLPLFDADDARAVAIANDRLEAIAPAYRVAWETVMRAKLGLTGVEAQDGALADAFLIAITGADWTLAFRRLADAAEGREAGLLALLPDPSALVAWLPLWRARLGIVTGPATMSATGLAPGDPIAPDARPHADPDAGKHENEPITPPANHASGVRLRAANPAVIPRNHLVEAALSAANLGDLAPFHALLSAVQSPFAAEAGREAFTLPAPATFGPYVTFCGT